MHSENNWLELRSMVFLLKFMLSYLETCHNFSYNKLITCIGLPLYLCVEIHEPSVGRETFPVMSQLD